MSTENQVPTGIISQTGFTPDALVSDVNVDDDTFTTADDNNTNANLRLSYPTPSPIPTGGAGKQTITVKCRKNDYGGGGSNDPDLRIEIWETGGGSALAVSSTFVITNTTEQTETFDWDSDILAASDGSGLEVRVFAIKAGGGPTARAIVDFDFVQWNVDFTTPSAGFAHSFGVIIGALAIWLGSSSLLLLNGLRQF